MEQGTTPTARRCVAEIPELEFVGERIRNRVASTRQQHTARRGVAPGMSTVPSVNEFLQALVTKRLYEEFNVR